MKPQELYDRIADMPEFEQFHASKPMAIAEAFRTLKGRDTTDDEAELLADLAGALAVWGFAGTQYEAIEWLQSWLTSKDAE